MERSGRSETVEFDLAIHVSAGRIPKLAGLDLDAAGVEWDKGALRVAAHLQSTSNPALYASATQPELAEGPGCRGAVHPEKIGEHHHQPGNHSTLS